MHVTPRDVALESNMHDRIVNTCTQTAHMLTDTIHACHNKGRGLIITHARQDSKHMHSDIKHMTQI